MAKYRQAFTPSRAKNDPTDAELALDLLIRHPERFKPLRPQSVPLRKLCLLVEQRRRLVGDKAHNVRSERVLEARLCAIKTTLPLTQDAAVIEAHQLQTEMLVEQLRVTLKAIDRFDEEIAATVAKLPDYALLFKPLVGAGPVLAPRLLAAFGEDRQRYRGADEFQQYSGVAPVIERSGNKTWVHWRWQCPTFLRQTMVEWAGQTFKERNLGGLAPESRYRCQKFRLTGGQSSRR